MRWEITESKRKITAYDFEGHGDFIEISGEKVSGIVTYGVENNRVYTQLHLVFPTFRIQPDMTKSAYQQEFERVKLNFCPFEIFRKVEFDGVLSVYTEYENIRIVRRYYPSVSKPAFYERIEIVNNGDCPASFTVNEYEKLHAALCCEGWAYIERRSDKREIFLRAHGRTAITFCYSCRYANERFSMENRSYEKRMARVRELLEQCDLTTSDKELDTMFAFCKLRVGESVFKTKKGRVNSPGGKSYYVGVWTNDQSEYSTPWYGYTGDKKEREAALNAMAWYAPFMNDEYEPIPSSIISEGTDYWNMRRDRGDAAMYLSGNSRFFLESGIVPNESQQKTLAWCAEYTKRRINGDGVVVSDTDELEHRLSAGINLSTSSIAYGAFGYYAALLCRLGNKTQAEETLKVREGIKAAIERYFGNTVSGYETYDYHKDCGVIRAWNCMPVYFKIFDRAQATMDAIDDKLWQEEGFLMSSENSKETWDRSLLYYLAALFRMGDKERGYEKLKKYTRLRLLGEHVPYPTERWPEYFHLSAEGGLYCRIVTDGILNIEFTCKGVEMQPTLPSGLTELSVKRLVLAGKTRDICVKDGKVTVRTAGEEDVTFALGEKAVLPYS